MNNNKNCPNKLSITFLNVCGLKSKLLCPEFLDILYDHDISIFVESKLDEFDILELPPNFSYISKVRQKCQKKSGGIVIVYKTSLDLFLEFPKTDCEYVQWVRFKKGLLFEENDVLLGCIYLPPENTRYTSPEAFDQIDEEFNNLISVSTFGALLGDFNAKTGKLKDYTIPDENLLDVLDLNHDMDLLEFLYDYENLQRLGIPLSRVSQDNNKPNSYGYKLIEFCNRLNFYIGNSRLTGIDFDIGFKTCYDSSLIDYFILSSPLFRIVRNFSVKDFDPLFSDKHCRLTVTFDLFKKNACKAIEQTPEKLIRWNERKSVEFISVIQNDAHSIQLLIDKLDNLENDVEISDADLNSVVDDLTALFKNAAAKSFGFTNSQRRESRANSKPWFNDECKAKRKQFHKSRKKYSFMKNVENRNLLNAHSKEYKYTLNKNYKKYQSDIERDLREKSKTDPKSLWKLLKKMSGENRKSKSSDNIDIKNFFEYFKKLNSNDFSDDDETVDIDDHSLDIFNEILNSEITSEEIIEAVKRVKNNKASGIDDIMNEHLKSTLDCLIPVYLKLFNLILDSGKIPESWLTGIVKPIFKNKGDPTDPDCYRAITLVSNLGKVFTGILNTRLNKLSDEVDLITASQAGFRKGYSTTDNIFILHALISLYLSMGKKLYCSFIDFKKAFDTVWRVGLWRKLQNNNIKGKIFTVIHNMYQGIKSCISYNEGLTDFFACEVGVRQGENLSPFLFALYLNDLESYFTQKKCTLSRKIIRYLSR